MKVAVYTAMSGDYDDVQPPQYVDEEFDYYFFTDNKRLEVPRPYKKVVRDWDIERGDKKEKTAIPKEFIGEYDYCVWHDASMVQLSSLKLLIKNLTKGWAVPSHKTRGCITEELDAVAYYRKAPLDLINRQVQYYLNSGLPVNYGLWECGFIIRNLNNPKVLEMSNQWWWECSDLSMRDQLSLPYVFWKNDYKPNVMPKSSFRGVYFRVNQHK